MLTYAFKRILLMVPVLLVVSFLVFFIAELPPGDFYSNRCAQAGVESLPGCPSR